ncbi:hypothetical protein [Bartonella sp. CB60]|uniref:hypothetical protein n=1 Tax=Bartonella sp. CB60 TaxID=3113619 RepID=UPI00300E058B
MNAQSRAVASISQSEVQTIDPLVPQQLKGAGIFSDMKFFEDAQRICKMLVTSTLVPKQYQGADNLGNAMIALDIAKRMGISPLMVMQNLHIINGRPSWSSSFIVSVLNVSGLFSPLRFRIKNIGTFKNHHAQKITHVTNKSYVAYAVEKSTGRVLEGTEVTVEMAIMEGWYGKDGSKWKTMPDQMGCYRAAAFFGRLYAPHLLNGIYAEDEVLDISDDKYQVVTVETEENNKKSQQIIKRPKGVQAALKKKAVPQYTSPIQENVMEATVEKILPIQKQIVPEVSETMVKNINDDQNNISSDLIIDDHQHHDVDILVEDINTEEEI